MTRILTISRLLVPSICLLLVLATFGAHPALAAGVVGNGTPSSCNENAFMSALSGGGSVTFNCGAAAKTITISAIKQISVNTSINGGGKITLKAKNTNHFQVFMGKTLKLKNITLINGAAIAAGAIENFGTVKATDVTFKNNISGTVGGGIHNYGTVKLKRTTFLNNQANNEGGAIFNGDGTVIIKASTFTGNKANNNSSGGAISNDSGTTSVTSSKFNNNSGFNGGAIINNSDQLNVTSSTFDTNTASNGGGAIMVLNGSMSMTTSTVNHNQAEYGAGVVIYGSSNVISRSTISNNTSHSDGGGIYASGDGVYNNITLSGNIVTLSGHGGGGLYQNNFTGTLNFVTVANNSADFGGGIYKDGSATGFLYVHDTVLSNNPGGNCAGTPSSLGYNLSSETYCLGILTSPGDKNNKNAKLGALANNGGPTQTHLPLGGSPLINKGTPLGGITTDQRGISRPQLGKVDIGSVEVQ